MQGKQLFQKAKNVIPGGVNSPVRSFKSIGIDPPFIKRGQGPYIVDEQGEKYIDYCMSWGALIGGHAYHILVEELKEVMTDGTSFGAPTRKEVKLAELITEAVPSIDKVRLTSSGTEAAMSAVRLARGYTGRNKIIKFEGAYHGHADHLLGRAGSGAATFGIPDCTGVPDDFVKHTIVLPFNDPEKLDAMVDKYGDDLAAIITEPVMANCGVIPPEPGFLEHMKKAASRCGAVLIFDEVITGFRLSYGGAQEYYGVTPDITCLGKIIGGGMPVGAFGGRKEIMDRLAPDGDVYQAGTLSGNPVSVTAGIVMLDMLKNLSPYDYLLKHAKQLCDSIENAAKQFGLDVNVSQIASMFSLFFTSGDISNYNDAQETDEDMFARFYRALLSEGIYLSPSAFETNFLSTAHSENSVSKTVEAVERVFSKIVEQRQTD